MDVELLTRKVVKVRFLCDVPLTTAIPTGTGYDHYEGFSQVSGVIKLQLEGLTDDCGPGSSVALRAHVQPD